MPTRPWAIQAAWDSIPGLISLARNDLHSQAMDRGLAPKVIGPLGW
jgi:hypothetical protein